MLSRRLFLTATAAALLAPALRAGAAGVTGGPAFGSHWTAVFGDPADAPLVERIVAREIARMDALASPYRAGSALSRFNRGPAAAALSLPRALLELVEAAGGLHTASGGAFDPTVGPLVHRFGFGPIEGESGGFAALEIAGGAIRKHEAGLTLDLCGLAKGAALDAMTDALAAEGVSDIMLELGGEIRTLGQHPAGRPWQIGVEEPRPGPRAVRRVLVPGARAVATSGHTTQAYPGASHIVDPRSGRPADPRLASVTVLAATAQEADGLATTLAVLGPEAGPDWAAANGVEALFILRDGTRLTDRMTGGFAAHVLS
jgi:thiamine biosynthesis lipoprotein